MYKQEYLWQSKIVRHSSNRFECLMDGVLIILRTMFRRNDKLDVMNYELFLFILFVSDTNKL